MKIGVFAGSFCPVTNGHVNVIERASRLVETLYVVIPLNVNKNYSISLQDRKLLLAEAVKNLPNVVVRDTKKALVDFCAEVNADVIIKSVRNAVDMQFEMDMAEINNSLTGIETVFLAADKKYSAVSSTYVRELAAFNKDITPYVPRELAPKITELLKK